MRSKLHIIIVHILLHTIDHYRFVSDDYKYIKEIVKLCSIFVSKTRADDFCVGTHRQKLALNREHGVARWVITPQKKRLHPHGSPFLLGNGLIFLQVEVARLEHHYDRQPASSALDRRHLESGLPRFRSDARTRRQPK